MTSLSIHFRTAIVASFTFPQVRCLAQLLIGALLGELVRRILLDQVLLEVGPLCQPLELALLCHVAL